MKKKQCQFGIGNYFGDNKTNVSSSVLTLSAVRKLVDTVMKSSDVPTQYIDDKGTLIMIRNKDNLMVERTFLGLKFGDAQPHLLKNFTEGKKYTLFYEDGFRFAFNDKMQRIMISNNVRKQYFL